MHYGEKIKQLRLAKGITQAELGKNAFQVSSSVGQTRIRRIEQGSKFISGEEISAICTVLEVDTTELDNDYQAKKKAQSTPKISRLNVYPELESLEILLDLAAERGDAYLQTQAWEAIRRYAEIQIKLLQHDHLIYREKSSP